MLELHHFGLSVCAHKVRMALGEKAVTWQSRIVDLHTGQQFAPEYLRLNPNGVVPTLVHDGQPIIESTVINEYLDDAFPEHPLRPQAATQRAQMRLWSKRIDDLIHPACGTLTIAAAAGLRVEKIRGMGQTIGQYVAQIPDAKRRARQMDVLSNGMRAEGVLPAFRSYEALLADMEAALGASPFLVGGQISLADINILPYILRLDMLGMNAAFSGKPALSAWYDRMRARPSFAAITGHIKDEDSAAMLAYGQQAWRELQALAA